MRGPTKPGRWIALGLAVVTGLAVVPTASAHGGSIHGGTPHWLLVGALVGGIGIVIAGVLVGRTDRITRPRLVLGGIVGGLLLATLGAIGLTEVQIEPLRTDATPIPRIWYRIGRTVAGAAILLGSLLLGIWRWERRPDYTVLGSLLGLWVVYPILIPGAGGYWHPLGYGLVLAVPLVVAFVLWRDVSAAFEAASHTARRVGVGIGVVVTVFLLFSTGQLTLNPEEAIGVPNDPFVVFTSFANPLVSWPAVEFYVPAVPLFGALSVGTLLTFALLAGLVGVNAVLATTIWRRDVPLDGTPGVLGGLATTGATACCCCAPAFYGVASAALGLSVSPLYWAFTDPASPLGALFFAGATALLVRSSIRFSEALEQAGACDRRSTDVTG